MTQMSYVVYMKRKIDLFFFFENNKQNYNYSIIVLCIAEPSTMSFRIRTAKHCETNSFTKCLLLLYIVSWLTL